MILDSSFLLNSATVNKLGTAGGAIFSTDFCSPAIVGCSFIFNQTNSDGGAIRSEGNCDVLIINSLFRQNSVQGPNAAAISSVQSSNVTAVNSTIANNSAGNTGAAIGSYTGSAGSFSNCIVWGNTPGQFEGSDITVSYSNIQGGFAGVGNIDADPQFVGSINFRLSPGSPCIDAGINSVAELAEVETDLDGNSRFSDDPETEDTGSGTPPLIDMGAYEYQAPCPPADFNGDGLIDTIDLLQLLGAWGTCKACDEDLNADGIVDTIDLLDLLGNWGECGA